MGWGGRARCSCCDLSVPGWLLVAASWHARGLCCIAPGTAMLPGGSPAHVQVRQRQQGGWQWRQQHAALVPMVLQSQVGEAGQPCTGGYTTVLEAASSGTL